MGISSQAKRTTMASRDMHVTIVPYFTVPEGKMDAFKAGFADFYKHTKEGKAELDKAVSIVGPGGLDLSVMGPAAELEKLKEALGPLGTKFYALDAGAISKM